MLLESNGNCWLFFHLFTLQEIHSTLCNLKSFCILCVHFILRYIYYYKWNMMAYYSNTILFILKNFKFTIIWYAFTCYICSSFLFSIFSCPYINVLFWSFLPSLLAWVSFYPLVTSLDQFYNLSTTNNFDQIILCHETGFCLYCKISAASLTSTYEKPVISF